MIRWRKRMARVLHQKVKLWLENTNLSAKSGISLISSTTSSCTLPCALFSILEAENGEVQVSQDSIKTIEGDVITGKCERRFCTTTIKGDLDLYIGKAISRKTLEISTTNSTPKARVLRSASQSWDA